MSDEQNTQIATRNDSAISAAGRYEPQNFNELARLSKAVVTSGLAPSSVRKPEDAMVILMTGAELGLRPMQSLRSIHVVKGKPVLSADLMKAVVEASGKCERWDYEEMSSKRCALTVQRSGRKPIHIEWTMKDAETAQLLSNDNWRKYPAQMLRHRADSDAARAAFPDLLMGLYTPDELEPGHSAPIQDARDQRAKDAGASGAVEAVEVESAPVNDEPRPDDVQDAEFEEAPQVHWTEVDYSAHAQSDDDAWDKARKHFFQVAGEGDCGEFKDAWHEFVKDRHHVDTLHRVPSEVLHKWAELLGKQSGEATIDEAGDPQPSERYQWMEEKIDTWRESQMEAA